MSQNRPQETHQLSRLAFTHVAWGSHCQFVSQRFVQHRDFDMKFCHGWCWGTWFCVGFCKACPSSTGRVPPLLFGSELVAPICLGSVEHVCRWNSWRMTQSRSPSCQICRSNSVREQNKQSCRTLFGAPDCGVRQGDKQTRELRDAEVPHSAHEWDVDNDCV